MSNIRKTFGAPTISGKGGGGSSVTVQNSSNLYYIVGGNTLSYLGGQGCIKVTTPITTAASGYSQGTPATLPNGLCWLRPLDSSNTLVLGVNDSTSYTNQDLTTQAVYAVRTGTITGGDLSGTNWSYAKYTIVAGF